MAKNVPEVPRRTPDHSPGPLFVASSDTAEDAVRVSPGKGGVSIGTPTGCNSKRAADNVKQY